MSVLTLSAVQLRRKSRPGVCGPKEILSRGRGRGWGRGGGEEGLIRCMQQSPFTNAGPNPIIHRLLYPVSNYRSDFSIQTPTDMLNISYNNYRTNWCSAGLSGFHWLVSSSDPLNHWKPLGGGPYRPTWLTWQNLWTWQPVAYVTVMVVSRILFAVGQYYSRLSGSAGTHTEKLTLPAWAVLPQWQAYPTITDRTDSASDWEGRLAWLIPDWVELDFGGVALVWYFSFSIEISYCWVITTDQFVYHWSVFVLRWPCAVARTKGRTLSRAGSLKLTWIPELSRTAAAFSVSRRCVKFKWWLTCTYAFRRKLWIP